MISDASTCRRTWNCQRKETISLLELTISRSHLTASVRFVALKENSGRQTVELVPRSQNHLECTKTCAFFTICLKILLCNYKACFKSTSLNPWIVNFRFGEVCIFCFCFFSFFIINFVLLRLFASTPPLPHTHTL